MPYIAKEHRSDYLEEIKELGMLVNLHSDLQLVPGDDRCKTAYNSVLLRLANTVRKYTLEDRYLRPGHLNFLFTSVIHQVYGKNLRYYHHNEIIGSLEMLKSGLNPAVAGYSKGEHIKEVFNIILLQVYGTKLVASDFIEIFGLVSCCSLEFYRRSTSGYEDVCIEKNGDVSPE